MKKYEIYFLKGEGSGAIELTKVNPMNIDSHSLGLEFSTKEEVENAIEEASHFILLDGKSNSLRKKGNISLTILEIYK